jgi:hypothetical protein
LETRVEVSENAMAAVKEALDQAVTHEKTVEAVRIALEGAPSTEEKKD